MKYSFMDLWIKIGGWVAVCSFVSVVLFTYAAAFSLLPTFGHLTIEENGKSQVYRLYDLSCRRVAEGTVISFHDEGMGKERVIQLSGGERSSDGFARGSRWSDYPVVLLDGLRLGSGQCGEMRAMTARHRGGKMPKIGEYRLILDCDVSGAKIQANLHGFSCSGQW